MPPIASKTALAVLIAAGLSVAGCYDREDNAPQPAPQPETAAMLGEVDLSRPVRALGAEPFWGG